MQLYVIICNIIIPVCSQQCAVLQSEWDDVSVDEVFSPYVLRSARRGWWNHLSDTVYLAPALQFSGYNYTYIVHFIPDVNQQLTTNY